VQATSGFLWWGPAFVRRAVRFSRPRFGGSPASAAPSARRWFIPERRSHHRRVHCSWHLARLHAGARHARRSVHDRARGLAPRPGRAL